MPRPRKQKEKINYKIRHIDRGEPSHNILKHWRIVRYWAKRRFDLTDADIDMIIFLYDERFFSHHDYKTFEAVTSWEKNRFTRLKKEGWINTWRKRTRYDHAIYELSYKGKKLVTRIYAILNGEEDFPESTRRNPVMKRQKYTDKVYSIWMTEINKINRERRFRQTLAQQSPTYRQ